MIEVNPIKFVTAKNLGFLAVHSEDVGGLTYVGRWVKTSLLEDISFRKIQVMLMIHVLLQLM